MNKELRGWLMVAGLGIGIWVYGVHKSTLPVKPLEEEKMHLYYAYSLYPDTDPEEAEPPVMQVEASASPAEHVRTPKRKANLWYNEDGSVNYFRCIILETKRREALGRPGAELKRYKDGSEWAIGYGNHVRYLSEYWKRTCKRQRWKVTEAQARAMMYGTFHDLCEQVKRDLPNTNRRQQLAVASLAFNWGYGNVKRSALWRHLKAGREGTGVTAAWMRTQVATENHRKSRRIEAATWNGDDATVIAGGKEALEALRKRGDFKHY